MTRDLSSLRTQVLAVQQQMTELLDTFLGRTPLLTGSLYTLRRRCGKPNCRCAQGALHASTVLSYRGQGRPQNISLAAEHLPDVRELTADYRRFRQARTQLLRRQRQLLALLDRIEAARVQDGERRFQQLRTPTPRTRSRRTGHGPGRV